MPNPSPAELILARAAAFRRCDYGFIFDTYHPDSNFRRQFPDRDEYIRYGWASLGKEFRILDCRILKEETTVDAVRVIHLLEFELHGGRQRYAELAWFEAGEGGWLYRYGQKLAEEVWPVPAGQLDFRHFDAVVDKVLY